jgi:hypothetical protein
VTAHGRARSGITSATIDTIILLIITQDHPVGHRARSSCRSSCTIILRVILTIILYDHPADHRAHHPYNK